MRHTLTRFFSVLAGSIFIIVWLLAESAFAQECPDVGTVPTPVEVAVTAVPIVVASTTDDYFVLYASRLNCHSQRHGGFCESGRNRYGRCEDYKKYR